MEEKERQRQLKMFVEDKEEIAKKRERVLSACGLRPPTNLCKRILMQMSPPK
jgi:hypothetical protein